MQFKRNNSQFTEVQLSLTPFCLANTKTGTNEVAESTYTPCVYGKDNTTEKAPGLLGALLLSRLNEEEAGPRQGHSGLLPSSLLTPFSPCPTPPHTRFATIPTGPAARRVTWSWAVDACVARFFISMVFRGGRFWRRSFGVRAWTGESRTLKGVRRQPFREGEMEGGRVGERNSFRDLISRSGCLSALGSGDF